MSQIPINSGDSLIAIAQRQLGDFSKWREVADLNGLNPLQSLPIGQSIDIPGADQLLQQAQPLLSGVAQGLNGVQGQISAALEQGLSQVTGYVAEAQALLGEVNGVLGEVESIAPKVLGGLGNRAYKGEAVKLIDWLLN